jgi:AcrR family transcriptional regulator
MSSEGQPVRSEEQIEDGRVRRGARNRAAIADALVELVSEGSVQPTAEQVAERAGVRVRTVFRHFDDMESLHLEIQRRVRERVQPLFAAVPTGGSLDSRIRALVRTASEAYEQLAPFKRTENAQRYRYAFIQRDREAGVRAARGLLQRVIPELREAPAPLASALELVLSFEAWDRLRTDQRLGVERARAATEAAALAIVAAIG